MPGLSMRNDDHRDAAMAPAPRDQYARKAIRACERWAPLFQIFDPLITHSSPSRTARVRRLARSVPALGSE